MDWETFWSLGEELLPSQHANKDFVLANGKSFRSIGQVKVDCSFAQDEIQIKYKVQFNVFERLAAPVIIGREFLDHTQTFTVYTDRLKVKSDREDNVLRVMHISRPSRRLQCTVNGNAVYANPDTGADMNLVSPFFAENVGYGQWRRMRENRKVEFADGSTDSITSSFLADFSIPGYDTSVQAPTRFYVLGGLTSEVLVGEELLFNLDVFRRHSNSLIDVPEHCQQSRLNIIKWLTKTESKMIEMLKRTPKATTTKKDELVDPNIKSTEFHKDLAEADGQERYRRTQAQARISKLSTQEQAAERDSEHTKVAEYDRMRTECLSKHQERLKAQKARGDPGGCAICSM